MKIMSLRRREQLVRLARRYDALIVTDDVYDFLQWPSAPGSAIGHPDKAYLPRVVDVDRYLDGGPKDEWGNAVSNGSFSKLLGPGVRTGWAEGTAKFANGLSQTYGPPALPLHTGYLFSPVPGDPQLTKVNAEVLRDLGEHHHS